MMDDDEEEEEEEEELEPRVSSLELFSDLVMAVSIHIVAHPLETATDLWQGEMAVPMYLVRVFLLWRGWQSNMSFTNVANLWSPHGMLTGPHYIVVFCFMVCLLLVAQACNAGNERLTIMWYLIARLILFVAYAIQVYQPPPDEMDEKRAKNMKGLIWIMLSGMMLTEIIPLVLAWFLCLPTGEASVNAFLLMLVTPLLVVAVRTRGALKMDQKQGHSQKKFYATSLIQERYELIILIFAGEICFGAAVGGSFILTCCAMVAAASTFLLYFIARPHRTIEPWVLSAGRSVLAQHLHWLLFCSIPGIGAAFARLIEEANEEGQIAQFEQFLFDSVFRTTGLGSPNHDSGGMHPELSRTKTLATASMPTESHHEAVSGDPHSKRAASRPVLPSTLPTQ